MKIPLTKCAGKAVFPFAVMIFMALLVVNVYQVFGQKEIALVTINTPDKNFNKAVSHLLSGEFDDAIVYFKRAHERSFAQVDCRQMVEGDLGLTNCYFFKGEYSTALEYCALAIDLHTREVKNDPEGFDSLLITQSLCAAALRHTQADPKSEIAKAECFDY